MHLTSLARIVSPNKTPWTACIRSRWILAHSSSQCENKYHSIVFFLQRPKSRWDDMAIVYVHWAGAPDPYVSARSPWITIQLLYKSTIQALFCLVYFTGSSVTFHDLQRWPFNWEGRGTILHGGHIYIIITCCGLLTILRENAIHGIGFYLDEDSCFLSPISWGRISIE